jgi:hypothetical protein
MENDGLKPHDQRIAERWNEALSVPLTVNIWRFIRMTLMRPNHQTQLLHRFDSDKQVIESRRDYAQRSAPIEAPAGSQLLFLEARML